MKTVILCGGLGSRLSEETQKKPKPMVTVGGLPICVILLIFIKNGFNDFILATGYKLSVIKNYFSPKVIKNWAVKLRLFLQGVIQ